jgi:hypothetical protein
LAAHVTQTMSVDGVPPIPPRRLYLNAHKCRETLEGLTQFGVSPVESQLQVIDSKDGEMSEWLKEHAWKLL